MSSGEGMSLARAREVASDIMNHLENVCRWHCVAGSIRREKAVVGDVEIVILPNTLSAVLNRLDILLEMGVVDKALYGEKKQSRWGDTYRGMIYQGQLVEVFICDEHNRGYVQWLRTGAGEKNTYVMSRMKACKSPVRFSGGYGWHVSYDSKHPAFNFERGYARLAKLHIPDEETLYHLLRMPVVPPKFRETKTYQEWLWSWVYCPDAEKLVEMYVPELKQGRLF